MTTPEKTYYMRWMNRTHYKNATGKPIIKQTPRYNLKEDIMKEYERATDSGFACCIMVSDLKKMDCIDIAGGQAYERYFQCNRRVLIENDRWKIRMTENDIRKLKIKKADAERHLKEIEEQLKKLQGD